MNTDAAEAAIVIPLTRGKFTYVSREDADLKELAWHSTSHGRAARTRVEDHKTIYLHRVIAERMGIVREVDHIDGDPLNNRRANLRGCTRTQNQANAPKSRGSTSRYKGVHWSESHGGWVAQIKHNEKVTYLGQFDEEIDAAITYDVAAKKEFGEYANLNFPIVQTLIEKATDRLEDDKAKLLLCIKGLESRAAHASEQADEIRRRTGCKGGAMAERANLEAHASEPPQSRDEQGAERLIAIQGNIYCGDRLVATMPTFEAAQQMCDNLNAALSQRPTDAT